jgi:hypothetical protein
LLLLLLLSVASSRFRFVVEAASTPPTHVSVGAGLLAPPPPRGATAGLS